MTGASTATPVRASFTLRCGRCDREATGSGGACLDCGAPVDAVYPKGLGPAPPAAPADADALARYASILPVADPSLYRLPLPVTPLVDLDPVGDVPVAAKVEGVLPTGSTKDRLIAVSLPFMLEQGIRRFAFSSTGNTALAYAHGLHMYPEMEASVYVSHSVDRSMLTPVPPNLGVVVVDGDYAAASARVRDHAERTGFVHEGGFFNVGRREGAKLAFMEALEELAERGIVVGAVVQAVASGLGIYAAARAVGELARAGRIAKSPRLFCVQQESCAPMVRAYHSRFGPRSRHVVRDPSGVATAILLGDPFRSYESVAAVVRESGGDFVAVTEADVRRVLAEHDDPDVPLGASASVALAAVPRIARSCPLEPGEAVLVMLTGGPGR